MGTRILIALMIAVLAVAGTPGPGRAQLFLDLESGMASAGYNDVRIPGAGGTRISFTDELSSDATAFARFRATYRFGDRHNLSVLAAPLTIESAGSVDRPVRFNGVEFPAATPLKGTFRFDSYRLTYRWDFHRGESLRAGIGFTAKIRDAAIGLAGGGLASEKTNTGFVPIVNFALDWKVRPATRLVLEGDALAAPQGRAEDVFAGVLQKVHPRATLKAGYRLLEGGADNDEVYTFTLVNYAVLGLVARF